MSARRWTRRLRCPICGGADSDPRGRGLRCFGFLSSDGRYAHCSRVECGRQENGGTWAHRLGPKGCRCGQVHDAEEPPERAALAPRPSRDFSRIWEERFRRAD
jgi:hypothetical protein